MTSLELYPPVCVTLHYIHDKEVPNGNTIVSDNLNTKETYISIAIKCLCFHIKKYFCRLVKTINTTHKLIKHMASPLLAYGFVPRNECSVTTLSSKILYSMNSQLHSLLKKKEKDIASICITFLALVLDCVWFSHFRLLSYILG